MSVISLPILTAGALANGLNPCGIGMLITFLGYLLVFGGKKGKQGIVRMGIVYLLSVFVTYLMLGLFFYGAAHFMQRWWLAGVFKYIIGGMMFLVGGIQVKDAFWPNSPIHLVMPMKGFLKINALMDKMTVTMAAVVGFLTTVFSTPCMLPLYAGTAVVLARSGLGMGQILGYFLYYNTIFILPMILVLVIMIAGKEVVEMKEWGHKNEKWMRLVMGIVILVVGWMIIK